MVRPLRLAPFLAVAALAAASVVVPVLGRGVASAHDEAKRSLYDRFCSARLICRKIFTTRVPLATRCSSKALIWP